MSQSQVLKREGLKDLLDLRYLEEQLLCAGTGLVERLSCLLPQLKETSSAAVPRTFLVSGKQRSLELQARYHHRFSSHRTSHSDRNRSA